MNSMSGMSMALATASSTMSSKTMSMASSTVAAAAATASAATERMHGMDMGGDECKISMLWNWYTVDACFVSHTWHITSKGMFAGSCVGVILLVILLEFLRRAGKDYDQYILRDHQRKFASASAASSPSGSTDEGEGRKKEMGVTTRSLMRGSMSANVFRPTLLQQMVRAGLHMIAFAVAYFIMLLAMYYNGYIIICIFVGAYLGFFIFGWESVDLGGPAEDTTVCCG